ncbi:alpha-amylase family glycosyl hydrolase, partial [Actinomyces polynesiensis]
MTDPTPETDPAATGAIPLVRATPPPPPPSAPTTGARPLPPVSDDPQWYRRAVFYEVLLHSFEDSNGDGVGDFQGLVSKLDYLQWLGVDAL